MRLRQRVRFYQQLAVLTRAGVPLRGSLHRLQERIGGRQISILAQQIDAGHGIGEAFIAAGFTTFESHLVTAGERSARLENVYDHLAQFWKHRLETRQAFVSQLAYPAVLIHLSVFATALPIAFSQSTSAYVLNAVGQLIMIYAFIAVCAFAIRLSWQNAAAQRAWLRVPLLGGTLAAAYHYRWITALRLEFIAGIPLPEAVADAWRSTGFADRDHFAREGREAMLQGTELSVLVQRWKGLPRNWVDFIETGEISGALETALTNLEGEAENTWKLTQERMRNWLPKILSFIILLFVGWKIIGYYSAADSDTMKMINDASS